MTELETSDVFQAPKTQYKHGGEYKHTLVMCQPPVFTY